MVPWRSVNKSSGENAKQISLWFGTVQQICKETHTHTHSLTLGRKVNDHDHLDAVCLWRDKHWLTLCWNMCVSVIVQPFKGALFPCRPNGVPKLTSSHMDNVSLQQHIHTSLNRQIKNSLQSQNRKPFLFKGYPLLSRIYHTQGRNISQLQTLQPPGQKWGWNREGAVIYKWLTQPLLRGSSLAIINHWLGR